MTAPATQFEAPEGGRSASAGERVTEAEPWRLDPTCVSVVWAVVRRLWPFLVEATMIPTAAYYVALTAFGEVSLLNAIVQANQQGGHNKA